MTSITRDELIEELRRLKDELGKVPSANDMRDRGEYSVSPYRSRFGSWGNAVRAAGFTPRTSGKSLSLSREELIAELKRLAEELGRPPSQTDMETAGKYSPHPYHTHFGSWNTAVEAAGFDPTPKGGETLQREELIEELQRLADEVGRAPTTDEMQEHGEYSLTPYSRHFDSWRDALEAAGLRKTV